jgi:hypothetical protein
MPKYIQDADVKGSADVSADSSLINANKIYVTSLGKRLEQAITNGDIGGGSGINYITNFNAETDTTGWATYADAAGALPVDGTGGSPNVTWTRTTSTPLRGTGSFLFTKDAANRQGQGASYDFTIAEEDKAKPLQIRVPYQIASGTYSGGTSSTDSDLTCYIYDVTNAVVIQPSGYKLDGGVSSVNYVLTANFQAASNSSSYRLIFHVATTSASAYTVKLDDISVGPVVYAVGAAAYDPTDYTPTYAGFGTVTTTEMKHSRQGAIMRIQGKITLGTTTATTASMTLPGSLTANVSAIRHVGYAVFGGTTAAPVKIAVLASSASNTLNFGVINASLSAAGGTSIGSSGDVLSLDIAVPITGWSANSVVSSETDSRVCAARYATSNTTSIANATFTMIDFTSLAWDTHGAVTGAGGGNNTTGGSGWKFVAPLPGFYTVASGLGVTSGGGWGAGESIILALYKNGSEAERITRVFATTTHSQAVTAAGATTIQLNAGDNIQIAFYQDSGASLGMNGTGQFVAIERVSGPNQIAASESVYASAKNSGGQSISNSTVTNITGWTIDTNSHNSLATDGQFTAPISGEYEAHLLLAYATNAVGDRQSRILLNGSAVAYQSVAGSATLNIVSPCSWQGKMIAGDIIRPATFQSSGGALSLAADNNIVKWMIKRIGN